MAEMRYNKTMETACSYPKEDRNMKAAIYCRLSEEDRNKQNENDDSGSIKNQKAMLVGYAMEKGWEIYNIYSDDDYTGADRRRPEFNRLLQDAEQHRFDIVLCKTQSRFTRELELVEKYIHGLFPLWGIRFVSIVDNADTANKGNKKSRQINGLVNEWYLEDMSDNIKSVLTNRRQNGFHIGAFALYGYKKDPDKKGCLIIDEDAAAVVREVFTLYAQGYGKTAIARILNDRGIPNPTEYKRLHGLRYQQPKKKNSTLWKYFAISDMLENEMYIGNMVQGKYGSVSYKTKENKPRPKESWYRVEGTHEPIIDMELWNKVAALREEKAKPFSGGTIGLFARKAKCAYCGYTMRSGISKGNRYLKCPTKYASDNACIGSYISVKHLERLVIDEINSLSAEYLDKDELERAVKFNNDRIGQKEKALAEIASYKKKISEYAKGLQSLYLDKVKGIISEADYIAMSKEFSEERLRLEKQVDCLNERISVIETAMTAKEDKRQTIDRYVNLEHLNREIVDELIDHISVGRRIPGTRDVPIEIHWNF